MTEGKETRPNLDKKGSLSEPIVHIKRAQKGVNNGPRKIVPEISSVHRMTPRDEKGDRLV